MKKEVMSIYNGIFPEKKKSDQIPLVNYAIKLSLVAPKNNNYNFMDEECDGIDINGTFLKVVDRYNDHVARKVDEGNIINVEVQAEAIIFTLRIKAVKNISTTIGNSMSKWLYTDYHWNRLTVLSDTKMRQKLFSIKYVEI